MLADQLQDGVYALITELKTMFFESKGYFIIFLFVRMSRRGHINCSEPKGNYVTDINELCYRRPSSWRGGGGGHTLIPFIGLHKLNNRVE